MLIISVLTYCTCCTCTVCTVHTVQYYNSMFCFNNSHILFSLVSIYVQFTYYIFSILGTYIDGRHIELMYIFEGFVTLPCRMDLRKYPFGIQHCLLKVWIEDVTWTAIKFNTRLSRNSSITEKKVKFYGKSRTLGEYYLLDSVVRLGEYDSSIVFELTLKGLYGFHLLNSFTPSLLIYLICYATLFFPVHDFNERVMVSLTSLLVLTALFTQASNASVRTSYFKYLDIWYVVLTTFCFCVVMVNIYLHEVWNKIKKKISPHKEAIYKDVPHVENSTLIEQFEHCNQVIWYYNLIFKIIFGILLLLFLMLFCFAAIEII